MNRFLQEELEAGRIYMIDTNMLEVVGDGGILMPILTGFALPMIVSLGDCVYYHDRNDKMRPIAIRLGDGFDFHSYSFNLQILETKNR